MQDDAWHSTDVNSSSPRTGMNERTKDMSYEWDFIITYPSSGIQRSGPILGRIGVAIQSSLGDERGSGGSGGNHRHLR